MFVLGGLVSGAVIGAAIARKHGGKLLDMLQYAAGFGIAFSLVGVFVTVILNRI